MRGALRILIGLAFLSTASSTIIYAAENAPRISVNVDVTEAPRKIFHALVKMPVKSGPLTLYYPKWIPGEHGPTGPIVELTGLKFRAAGKEISWQRDLLDTSTFHCDIPRGATNLEIALDYISPIGTEGFSAAGSATSNLTVLSWNQLLLYPQGWSPDKLVYEPALKLPDGWKYGSALVVEKESNNVVHFKPVSLNTLVDSPVISGRNFRKVDISYDDVPHHINMAGDTENSIDMPQELVQKYKNLVREANDLFGEHHYRKYDFLYAFSDFIASFGLEHHESSDNRVGERTLSDPDLRRWRASLLPHEMVHSWNGKYRRPAGLVTPDFQMPMKTDLLWVYEGLTQYLGVVLAARSGLWTEEDFREYLAWVTAYLDLRSGRAWRPLIDTAVSARDLYEARQEWGDWRRRTDFYQEMILVWLEADTLIRQKTEGKSSLDDFCKRFHGGKSGPPEVKPYTLEDVISELNAICPNDWKTFFQKRIYDIEPRAPLTGVEASGWHLVFTEQPNVMLHSGEVSDKYLDLRFTFGMTVKKEGGAVQDVIVGSPAAEAGVAPGMKLIAVNGRKWSEKILQEAVAATKKEPNVDLLLENSDIIKTYKVKYKGGERQPHIERNTNADLLEDIIQPHVK